MKIYTIMCLSALLPAAALAFEGQEQAPAPTIAQKPADASQPTAAPSTVANPKPSKPATSKSIAVDKEQQYLQFLVRTLKNETEQSKNGK